MRSRRRRLPRARRTSAAADLRSPVLRLVVFPNQARDIHARHRIRGHAPCGRRLPIAAIDESLGSLDAVGLRLGQRHRRSERLDQAGAVAPVPTHPVDIDPIARRMRPDFEVDPFTDVHAHLGGEALDRRVAVGVDIPFRSQVPGLAVFRDDLVRRRRTRIRGGGSGRRRSRSLPRGMGGNQEETERHRRGRQGTGSNRGLHKLLVRLSRDAPELDRASQKDSLNASCALRGK